MHFPQIHGKGWGITSPSKAPPLGELAGASPTERARLLTENHRHCDSIALTKSLPIAAPAALSCRACPLRHCFAMPPPLPRGGFGIAENFSSSPEAPLLGATATTAASGGNREELLGPRPAGCERQRSRRWEPQPGLVERSETERLYGGGPDLCSKAHPLAPRRAFSVQTKAGRHANGSPFGGAGEEQGDETERARPLPENHRHSDSIALIKSLPIAAQRLFRAGLALSVIASQCHLSQRERLWRAASFPVSFWRKEWYNGFAALPAHFMGREVKPNGVYFYLYPVRRSECSVLLHLQVA